MRTNMLSQQPRREALEETYLGLCDIDDASWLQVGNRTLKRCARRGSRAAREAHATTPHPTNKNKVICWLFLALCFVACPASALFGLLKIHGGAL